ncbi:alanine racemase [Fictibacillus gelatini]|uniref:alanine racemase n=1 Tax=Fictibacillus gelatini TaxID=225985 RepID=UPI0004291A82|nr:alanine racemase [Fictibacillus gelatini]
MNEQKFYRDTWAEIDLTCIEHNIRSIKAILTPKAHVMAVVKANGYGHGAVEVAKRALEAGASFLGVALLDEAISLREAGIKAPILVLGRVRPQDVAIASNYQISLTVFQSEWVREALEHLPSDNRINVHIKLDTGMGRIGLREIEEVKQLIDLLMPNDKLIIEGIFTHFATADELDSPLVEQQLTKFREMVGWLKEWGVEPAFVHCANSAATLRFPEAPFNLFRVGIAMYGLSPSPELKKVLPVSLKEAFSLHSRLIHVKKIQAGDTVSYGATYTAKGEEWIGTIPIGYADGWMRRYAEGGHVIVGGVKVPIVGRICMDQCMVRLPYEMKIGELVTMIGRQGKEEITIDSLAKQIGTINYEIPCLITARVPRIYKKM